MESFKPYLAKVATGAALTREEARAAFDALLSGEVTRAQAGGFLMALRVRGEALDERSEEHTSELQSRQYLVCRLLLEKKKIQYRKKRLHQDEQNDSANHLT